MRTAWGEYFGLSREEATMERMAACLRRMGFDYIFDTNFSADLTIMEEGNEFLHRFQSGGLSSPVIKCKKRPRKKCSFVAEVKGKR